jgi:KaiC/GvpD/RAD55 family RecA-like ATPase
MKYLLHILLGLNLLGTTILFVQTELRMASLEKSVKQVRWDIDYIPTDSYEDKLRDIENLIETHAAEISSELLWMDSKINTIDSSVEEIKDKLGISVW